MGVLQRVPCPGHRASLEPRRWDTGKEEEAELSPGDSTSCVLFCRPECDTNRGAGNYMGGPFTLSLVRDKSEAAGS